MSIGFKAHIISPRFPTVIDKFPNPAETDDLENGSEDLNHDIQHRNANDAINALETKLGINGSTDVNSIDYQLNTLITDLPDVPKRILKGIQQDVGRSWTSLGAIVGSTTCTGLISCGNGAILAGTLNGHIWRSTNYGLTWADLGVVVSGQFIYSMLYLGNGVVLAGGNKAGGSAAILRSTDYGLTWSNVASDASVTSYSGMTYLGKGIVIAGRDDTGVIIRSTDYGATWSTIGAPTGFTRSRDIISLGNGIALIAGAGTPSLPIAKSFDWGVTWRYISSVPSGNDVYSLVSLGNNVVLAGTQQATTGIIYRSINGGVTWDSGTVSPATGETHVWRMLYCGNGVVIAGTRAHAHIIFSHDYGLTWEDSAGGSLDNTYLWGLCYVKAGLVLAGTGTQGRIYRSVSIASDPRPLHAETHIAAGSDPLTLSESQITNLTTDLNAKQATIARTTTTCTSSSLANEASDTAQTLSLGKGCIALKLQTDHAAWVRIYTDTTAQSNDSGRTVGTDPASGAGVLLEVLTTGSQTINLSPPASCYNSASATSTVPVTITNRSGSTQTIQVTVTYIPLEA